MKTKRPNLILAASVSALLASLLPVKAANFNWTNAGTGDWATPGNWDAGTPGGGGGNFVFINNGGTANITSTTNSIQDPFIGNGGGAVGHVNQTAGDHSNVGWTFIGRNGGTGTWDLSGSTNLTTGRIYLGGTRDVGGAGTGTMTVSTTGTVTATSDLSVGTVGGTGTLNVTSGNVKANSWMIIGETQAGLGGSTGVVNQTGGTVTNAATDGGGRLWLGSQESGAASASSGTYNLIGGTLNARGVAIGRHYTGIFNQSGGVANITEGGEVTTLGAFAGSTGTYALSGGTLNKVGNMQIGASGSGTMSVTGGTMNSTGFLVVGRNVGGTGTMTVSSGSVNHNDNSTSLIVGEEGTGTLTVSGTGLVNIASTLGLRIGHAATGNGTINLNGGTLAANFIQKSNAGSTAKINLDGGTLKSLANSADFFLGMAGANLEVKAGGANFDSNSFSATITQDLNGAGGFTKLGAGTVALTSGASTYVGATSVRNGTLAFSTAAAGATPQSLGVNNTVNLGVAATSSGTLQYTGGAATLDKNINALGNGLNSVANTGGSLLTLSGTIAKNGTNLVLNGGTGGITVTGTVTGGLPNSDLVIEGGVTTLNGANALYNGQTITRNGGTLNASGTFTGPFAVNSTGHLTAAQGATATLTVPALTLGAGGNVDFEFGAGATLNGAHDIINIANAGGLSLTNTGLYLYQTGGTTPFTTNGTYTLFDYTGTFTGVLGSAFTIANSQVGKLYNIANNVGATTIEISIANATITSWATNGSGLWSVGGNWTAGVPDGFGAIATFPVFAGDAGPKTVTVDGTKTVGVITFDNAANAYVLAGSNIILNNGSGTPLISQVNGSHTIAAPVSLIAATNVAAAAGTTLTVSGDITGPTASITLTGAGTVLLTGTNNYAATNVNSGIFCVGNGGTTGTPGNGAITLGAGTQVIFNRSNALALSNNISGTGSVTQNGAGTLTYSGSATYTGATALNGPFISDGTISGTSGIDIENATTLRNTSSTTVAGPITVAGNASTTASLTVQDTATVTANGTLNVASGASSTGTLNVSGGSLTAGQTNIGANAAGTLNMTGGTINATQFHVGQNTGGSGVVSMSAGTINVTNWSVIGQGGGSTGTFLMSGGTWNQNHTDFLTVGENGTGNFEMSGNSVLNNIVAVDTSVRGTNKGNVVVGRNSGGNGTWTLSDTATAHIRELLVGNNAGSTGQVNINGTSVVDSSYDFHIGRAGTGEVNINGGSLNTNSGWVQIGIVAGGTGTLNVNSGSISAREYLIGEAGTGVVKVTGGTLTATQRVSLGNGENTTAGATTGNGTLEVSGTGVANFNAGVTVAGLGDGAVVLQPGGTINDTGNFIIGNGGTKTGQMSVLGGTLNVNGELWVGQNTGGHGTLDVSNGTVNVNNWLAVGRAGATGTLTLSGTGVINKTAANHTIIGSLSGIGTVTQTGGSFNSTASTTAGGAGGIRLGENGGGNGLWDISGGTATADFISLGWVGGGTGELKISGTGFVTAENNVIVGEGGTGLLNLNGGKLKTTYVLAGGGTPQFNFDGGTLVARADEANFIRGFTSANLSILAAGATIDTNGFKVTDAAPMVGVGPVTKKGAGTLTLTGTQDYPVLNTTDGRTDIPVALGTGSTVLNATAPALGSSVTNISVDQTLASLNIGNGAVVNIGALPPPAPSLAEAVGGDDLGLGQQGGELAGSVSAGAVPEPGSAALLLGGIATLLGLRRRRA